MSSTNTTIERPLPVPTPDSKPQLPSGHPLTPLLRREVALHIGVLAAFALLPIGATWPLLTHLWWSSFDYGDTLTSAYWMSWQAHALITNPLHLFDTNTLYPFQGTLAYDELDFGPALLAAPIFWLTGNSILAYNAVTLATFVLAGYGAWVLGRALTGSSWAGLVVGVAYAFSFYRFNHINHITLVSGEWLPFMLLCLHRLWQATGAGRPWRRWWRWAAGFALFFTLQCYSSHYLAFYTALVVAAFAVYYPLVTRRLNRSFFAGLMVAGVAGGLLLAPIGLTYVLIQSQYDFARPLWDTQRYSDSLQSFLAVWAGNPLYRTLLAPFADPGPWPWERSAFPGLVPLLLGGIGGLGALVRGRGGRAKLASHPGPLPSVERARRKILLLPNGERELAASPSVTYSAFHTPHSALHVGFYGLLALGAVLIMLGPSLYPTFSSAPVAPLPYRLLFDWVPGVQSMRAVGRAGMVFTLGLSVLAGYGLVECGLRIAEWGAGAGRSFKRYALPALAVIACGGLLFETWSAPIPVLAAPAAPVDRDRSQPIVLEPLATGANTPPVYQWLAGQPREVTVEYPMVNAVRGPRNVGMRSLYQYYAATHWQPTLNGAYTLLPSASTAVEEELEKCFPCPRSLDVLAALDVQRVVVHLENLTGPQQEEFLWRQDPANIPNTGLNPGEFTLAQDFHEVRVYELGPRAFTGLRDHLPPGVSLILADKPSDPFKIGAYTAALGWWLRDHPQYGDPEFSFGQPITQWRPGTHANAAILYAGQDPAPYGFTLRGAVWHNEHVVLYVHQ